jgi:hypothetical protein
MPLLPYLLGLILAKLGPSPGLAWIKLGVGKESVKLILTKDREGFVVA